MRVRNKQGTVMFKCTLFDYFLVSNQFFPSAGKEDKAVFDMIPSVWFQSLSNYF